VINYTVGLIFIHEGRPSNPARFVGSGTLVQIDDVYGVLTANHVLDELQYSGQIGLVLPLPGQAHRYEIDASHLTKMSIASCQTDADGPDLGLVILPRSNVGEISAFASFYNLSFKRDMHVDNPITTKAGIWVLCGFPGEYLSQDNPTSSFQHVLSCCCLCGLGTVTNEYSAAEYDYLDIVVNYKNDLPSSFCGLSGGGVWQVLLENSSDGSTVEKDTVFSGVAFYQSEVANNERVIKCHGRRSVYKSVYDYVLSQR